MNHVMQKLVCLYLVLDRLHHLLDENGTQNNYAKRSCTRSGAHGADQPPVA